MKAEYGDIQHPFLDTPSTVADVIRPLIEGKVICDVGCRVGVFMDSLAKYAKEVVGIEKDRKAYQIITASKEYNIIFGDARRCRIPEADVYYVWVEMPHSEMLIDIYKRIKHKTVIFGSYFRFREHLPFLDKGITIDVPKQITESGWEKVFQLTIMKPYENSSNSSD